MLQERMDGIQEELMDVENIPELKAIWCNWQAEAPEVANNMWCIKMLQSTLCRLKLFPAPEKPKPAIDVLMEQLRAIKATRVKPQRTSRKYRLIKTDVNWSTKPQVHAVMRILAAHLQPGDVVDEADIVKMMEANESVLQTKQGGKRIWDYYKGDHHEGLAAHGNVEKL